MSESALTVEQQQRLTACDNASRFLRNGGASLANNTTQAAPVVNIIDLAHYIVTGDPYGVAHAHQHMSAFPGHIATLDIQPGSLQADALGGLFNQAFGFNPFAQDEDGEKSDPEDVEAPDFD